MWGSPAAPQGGLASVCRGVGVGASPQGCWWRDLGEGGGMGGLWAKIDCGAVVHTWLRFLGGCGVCVLGGVLAT